MDTPDPEKPRLFGASQEKEQTEVDEFSKEVTRVLGLFKKAEEEGSTDTDRARALEAAAGLLHYSHLDLDIRFLVSVPEGVRSELSENWTVTQENVHRFEATHVKFVGYGKDGFQIDFHDAAEEAADVHWLSVYSYDIEIGPIPDEPETNQPDEPGAQP